MSRELAFAGVLLYQTPIYSTAFGRLQVIGFRPKLFVHGDETSFDNLKSRRCF